MPSCTQPIGSAGGEGILVDETPLCPQQGQQFIIGIGTAGPARIGLQRLGEQFQRMTPSCAGPQGSRSRAARRRPAQTRCAG